MVAAARAAASRDPASVVNDPFAEPLVRAVMTHVPGTVAAKYILHGLGRIGSPRVRLPLVGPEEFEAAQIEDELALVGEIPGVDLSNFRPDRNAAAGGALPKVAGTTR